MATRHQPSDYFKTVIENYLTDRASYDELFAVTFANPNKSMDECISFILNEVYKSGRNGFDDSEIYSLAVHYWDEPNLQAGNRRECNVIVNHTIELTEQERAEARREAIKRVENETYSRIKQTPKATKRVADTQQMTLDLF